MQFNQTGTVPQLYAGNDGDPTHTRLPYYLLPQSVTGSPATIGFADSWSAYAGTYIFLKEPLASGTEAAFAAAAWAFLADPRMQGARFVWFNNPDGSGLLTGTAIQVYQPGGGGYATAFPVTFGFRNVSLFLGAKSAIAQDVAASAFTMTGAGGGSISLNTSAGRVAINADGALTLPMSGGLAGCLQLSVTLTQENLDQFDVGMRYFYAIPPATSTPDVPWSDDSFFLASLRYPIFNGGTALYPNLDPLAPLDGSRTFLAFNGSDAGQSPAGAAPVIPAYFNSTMGDPFSLLPLSGGSATTSFAALVFAENRQSSTPSPHDPFYLVPSGDFTMQIARSGAVQMMCGLSGVEYIGLNETANTNLISFYPGGPAFATGFYPGESPGFTTLAPQIPPTTSFSVVTSPAALNYFAQPDQSVLYNYAASLPNGVTIAALAPVPVLAATINPLTGSPHAVERDSEAPLSFPLLPYSGVRAESLSVYQQMESQIVSPTRRLALAAAPPQEMSAEARLATTTASKYSTTPQGLLAYLSGVSTWEEIILGITNVPFALTNVTGDLLKAFQSNKLFLVISLASSIEGSLTADNAQINIGTDSSETWNFNLDPMRWKVDNFGTIIIIKFSDLTIQELAGQTSTWAFPATFNSNPAATSSTIESIIDDVDPDDPDFASFYNAVTNPSWNGVLMLNVYTPIDKLPSELAGLGAGIDKSKFYAHHVGITASKITIPSTPGDLGITDSSIFGLINYTAPSPLQPNIGDYQFQVEKLKVLFTNSAVAAFSSIIDLQINILFGEVALLQGSNDNIVKMYGVYQKQTINGQTQESYAFQTQSGQASVFTMSSNILNAVQISSGQFVTITSESSSSNTDSQFVFWGLLDFKALDNFDLFSFGREEGSQTPAGLNFGNLMIDMTFDPATDPPAPLFTFDASQLSFDMAGSTARAASFFNHFPLTIDSFTQAKMGATPAGAGYMGVQSPLNQTSLQYPWYSLNFNVNLGSPGALAAQVGFVASLTAAWAPSPATSKTYSVFTGLKLPGSSGSKRQISIQGIFSITFKTLEIMAVPGTSAFILVLYNIGFSFLSFSFPPTGQVNFVLFGDPDASAGTNTTLGWYAAYAKPAAQPGNGTKPPTLPIGSPIALPPGSGA